MTPFAGPKLRIQRANSHNLALAKLWNVFVEDDPYQPSLRFDENGAGELWLIQVHEIPDPFSFLVGEMLYQYRAALDRAVYAAAILEGGNDPPPDENSLQFPIMETVRKFKNAARHIAPLSQECKDLIESVQPYNAPELSPELMVLNFNRSLGILNDWARKDRHRKLHVVGALASNASPKFRSKSESPTQGSSHSLTKRVFWIVKHRLRVSKSRGTAPI